MRQKILAGNWKMNKLNAELPEFFESFAGALKLNETKVLNHVSVVFGVPYPLLDKALSHGKKYGFTIAAQNVHWEKSGAFTGEVSIPMLKEMGIGMTIIGHSERRQYFGETDATVAHKVKACIESKVVPIVCVGERKEERERNETNAVVSRQCQAFLEVVPSSIDFSRDLIIAYEPVWAIGTGLSATSEQAQEVHLLIRNLLTQRFGKDAAQKTRILYGGSASPKNIDELLTKPDIDGGLVGGASLKASDFAQMVLAGHKKL